MVRGFHSRLDLVLVFGPLIFSIKRKKKAQSDAAAPGLTQELVLDRWWADAHISVGLLVCVKLDYSYPGSCLLKFHTNFCKLFDVPSRAFCSLQEQLPSGSSVTYRLDLWKDVPSDLPEQSLIGVKTLCTSARVVLGFLFALLAEALIAWSPCWVSYAVSGSFTFSQSDSSFTLFHRAMFFLLGFHPSILTTESSE